MNFGHLNVREAFATHILTSVFGASETFLTLPNHNSDLGHRQKQFAALSLSADGDGFVLSQTVCENAPDALCRFSYSLDNKTWHELGKPFKARPGIWIGAKVGLFCSREHTAPAGGYADFDWFRVE